MTYIRENSPRESMLLGTTEGRYQLFMPNTEVRVHDNFLGRILTQRDLAELSPEYGYSSVNLNSSRPLLPSVQNRPTQVFYGHA